MMKNLRICFIQSGNLEKVGLQLLQSQMDVQEQILQYQLVIKSILVSH